MKELVVDIDQETKEFLNEIIAKTNEWRIKAENMQKVSKVHGLKVHLLCRIIDAVDNLFDLCAKN